VTGPANNWRGSVTYIAPDVPLDKLRALRAFYASKLEAQWTCNCYVDEQERRCALGWLPDGEWPQQGVDTPIRADLVVVNDGGTTLYSNVTGERYAIRGRGPRDRTLAYLDYLIARLAPRRLAH
jgi:hypothetical protein